MIVVAFQSAFHVEMYQNNFFYFLKIIFEISASNKIYKKINFSQKKIDFFLKYGLIHISKRFLYRY